jgi:hypothetical protein
LQITETRKKAVAGVSFYSPPDAALLELSSNTLISCKHQGEHGTEAIDVESITAIVAMVPHKPHLREGDEGVGVRHFVVEMPGLDGAHLGGFVENPEDDCEAS